MTFSVVGRSDDGRSWGVAVASKFLAVGRAVPAAKSGIGAIATQANANVAWRVAGLELLERGRSAEDAVRQLVDEDGRADRQIGIVDADGRSATHTGAECMDWAGGIAAPGVAIQGNILAGPDVVPAMKQAWDDAAQEPLAHRLVTALTAGDAAGGDRRGRQSAALFVVSAGAGYGGGDDIAVDLRVDDHSAPVQELARLLDLNDFYLSASPEVDRIPVTDELGVEIDDRVRALGHENLASWAGAQNYEMRVAGDGSWIDRRVLAILRGQ